MNCANKNNFKRYRSINGYIFNFATGISHCLWRNSYIALINDRINSFIDSCYFMCNYFYLISCNL